MDFEALMHRHPYVLQILPGAFMLSFDLGWMAIYDRLFTGFEVELLQDPASLRRFRLRQIKEKFGCMRVYYGFEQLTAHPPTTARKRLVAGQAVSRRWRLFLILDVREQLFDARVSARADHCVGVVPELNLPEKLAQVLRKFLADVARTHSLQISDESRKIHRGLPLDQ
nr:hypothetical protein [Thiomonas sp. FB-Cd]